MRHSATLGKEMILAIEVNNTSVDLLVRYLQDLKESIALNESTRRQRVAIDRLIELYDGLYKFYNPNNLVTFKVAELYRRIIPLIENSNLKAQDIDSFNALHEHSEILKKYVKGNFWEQFLTSLRDSWNQHQDFD